MFRAHEQLTNLLIGMIDDLNFDVVMQSEDAVKRTSKMVKDLVAVQITGLRSALEVAAQTHLVTSLLSEAVVAKDTASLVPMQDRFKAATDLLAKAAKTLTNEEIKSAIDELMVYGQGANSLFALRDRELAAIARADQTIEENVTIQRSLDRAVAVLVGDAEKSMQSGSVKLVEDLGAQPHAAADRRGDLAGGRGRDRRVLRAAPAGAAPHLGRRRDAPPLLGRDRSRRCRPRPTATRSARWRARSKCSARARSTAARWPNGRRPSRPRSASAPPRSSRWSTTSARPSRR